MSNPTCGGKPMHKAGHGQSGWNRPQRYKCNTCFRTTIIPQANFPSHRKRVLNKKRLEGRV